MATTAEAVGDVVSMRELRARLGLSQIELAVRAGVSIGVVQKLEGPGRVEPDKVQRIADALGVAPEEVDELRPSLDRPGGRGRGRLPRPPRGEGAA